MRTTRVEVSLDEERGVYMISVAAELAEILKAGGLRTFTVASDAPSERLRRWLKKGITTEDLLKTAHISRDLGFKGFQDFKLALAADLAISPETPPSAEPLQRVTEAALRAARPDLVIARISGYGQDGPYRDRAAFGVIGEAIGGLRHLTNHAPGTTDLPPVRVGVSIGDSIAGLYAAFGIMATL